MVLTNRMTRTSNTLQIISISKSDWRLNSISKESWMPRMTFKFPHLSEKLKTEMEFCMHTHRDIFVTIYIYIYAHSFIGVPENAIFSAVQILNKRLQYLIISIIEFSRKFPNSCCTQWMNYYFLSSKLFIATTL